MTRPWAIGPSIGGSKYPSIIDPAGDAELGDWMIAERVRRREHAELIVRAVNGHDLLVAALGRLVSMVAILPPEYDEPGSAIEQARAALKAAAP